jgi:hypothetical protein
MQRREFITLVGGAAAAGAWPVHARAQTGKTSRIGFLGTSSPSLERHLVDAFRQKLRELGDVEGDKIAIEYRWAEGRDSRLLASDYEIQTGRRCGSHVRFTPESGHFPLVRSSPLLGHKRTRHVKTSRSSRGGLPVRCRFNQTAARPC